MSGLLAGIYSAGDTAKRKLRGLLDDPIGTIQQQIGLLNDNAGKFNQLHSQATQESVNAIKKGGSPMGPASVALSNKLADAYNPMGITVWHGSPHKFSKFDSSKIGTGEGAQAYGHGLYLAESPSVAQQYQKDLSKGGDLIDGKPINSLYERIQRMADRLPPAKADLEYEKLGFLEDLMQQSDANLAISRLDNEDLVPWAQDLVKRWQPGGALYKVDLPDEHVAKMLDWDKPLSQQAPEVQSFFNHHPKVSERVAQNEAERVKLNTQYPGRLNNPALRSIVSKPANADNMKGAQLYEILTNGASIGAEEAQRVAAMREAGIPGIRYLDGGSRGAGGGTSNFVVFPGNEGLLSILERNGQPIK
jgi:hypothetical protein